MRDEIKISIILSSIIFIALASIWNIEFIGNVLLVFLLPISIIAIPVWIIILSIRWATTKKSKVIPIALALTPILIFPILKLIKALDPPIFLQAAYNNSIDGLQVKLYKNSTFIYQYSSLLGTQKYAGSYLLRGDTVVLTFEKEKPDYIKKNITKWVIEEDQFIEYSEKLNFEITNRGDL